MSLKKLSQKLKGGPGSGHRGHAGRKGKRGGSAPGKGGGGSPVKLKVDEKQSFMLQAVEISKKLSEAGHEDLAAEYGEEVDKIYDPLKSQTPIKALIVAKRLGIELE